MIDFAVGMMLAIAYATVLLFIGQLFLSAFAMLMDYILKVVAPQSDMFFIGGATGLVFCCVTYIAKLATMLKT